jgi:hypothetical protein
MMSWPRDNLDPNLAAIFSKQQWSSCQNASLINEKGLGTNTKSAYFVESVGS